MKKTNNTSKPCVFLNCAHQESFWDISQKYVDDFVVGFRKPQRSNLHLCGFLKSTIMSSEMITKCHVLFPNLIKLVQTQDAYNKSDKTTQ